MAFGAIWGNRVNVVRGALGVLTTCAALCLAQAAAPAKNVLEEELDINTIKLMAKHGQLIHLSYSGEEISYRMVAMLADAPPDAAWEAVSDVERYHEFVPEMLPVKVLSRGKDELTVEHTVQVKVIAMVKATEKYSTRYVFKKPRLYMHSPDDPKAEPGYWELVPVDGGKKTLLIYFDKAPDLSKMGSMVKLVIKAKPEFGLALQVSPVSILIKAMKSRAEEIAVGKK
ncbi:MAG: SRPBCC family protein [bacterium]